MFRIEALAIPARWPQDDSTLIVLGPEQATPNRRPVDGPALDRITLSGGRCSAVVAQVAAAMRGRRDVRGYRFRGAEQADLN